MNAASYRIAHHIRDAAAGLICLASSQTAIVTFLPPAPYTAIARGINDTNGVALVEVYALQ